ncbi:MFS transporter [Bradyrhizobium sp. LHD-71]|uniref:MFS transporter n=1 Tax=Bradyrhizobium sp. LHD-71 TaxID=3072141 RepID=UPI00280DFFF1|nr:MFS transporter [Bradyrhizobium sp. LHD-71]MDQ8730239.1 MFS transporter [Bradyrhizobium sp. LHD-71]
MDQTPGDLNSAVKGKSVQQYIDEHPIWADGTATPTIPLTRMQWRIWSQAAAGKFFEGMVVFMTGVALPLVSKEFSLGAWGHGVVAAASLLGILVGATMLGSLADRFGRKRMFITEMMIFTVFLVLICFSPNFTWLAVCLFGLGLALGCDYPTAHMVVSEAIPSQMRGRLVLSAFAFQAVGALTGTVIGYLILANAPNPEAWRWMYATAIIPALLVIIGRFYITESPQWLMSRGRTQEAEHETVKLLTREPPYPKQIRLSGGAVADGDRIGQESATPGWRTLFDDRNRGSTTLAAVPWFLQDLSTYGIGIFTPTILAASIGHEKAHATAIADIVQNDLLAAKGAALIDLLLIVGIAFAVALTDKLGRIRLQIFGFVGCAVGLLIATMSTHFTGTENTVLIFAGFMLFNFMNNIGPNAQTYLIAGEVFPTSIRGKGAGFAASFAKIGAVITAFLFPILLVDIGTQTLLHILMGASLLGAIVTWFWRIETRGTKLDQVGRN